MHSGGSAVSAVGDMEIRGYGYSLADGGDLCGHRQRHRCLLLDQCIVREDLGLTLRKLRQATIGVAQL